MRVVMMPVLSVPRYGPGIPFDFMCTASMLVLSSDTICCHKFAQSVYGVCDRILLPNVPHEDMASMERDEDPPIDSRYIS